MDSLETALMVDFLLLGPAIDPLLYPAVGLVRDLKQSLVCGFFLAMSCPGRDAPSLCLARANHFGQLVLGQVMLVRG